MQLNYSELLENKEIQRVYNTSYNPGAIVTLPDGETVSQERYEELLASGALDSLLQQNPISEDEEECDGSMLGGDLLEGSSDVERAEAMAALLMMEYPTPAELLDNKANAIDIIKQNLMDPCMTIPVKTEDEATAIIKMGFDIIDKFIEEAERNNGGDGGDDGGDGGDGGGSSYTMIYIGIFVVLLLIGGGATYFFMQNPDFFSKNKNTNSTK